jgi:hypothetical protein
MFDSQDGITYRSYSECTSKDRPDDNDFSGLVHCCACGGGDFTVNTLTLRIDVTTLRTYKFKINGTIDSKWGQISDDVLVGDYKLSAEIEIDVKPVRINVLDHDDPNQVPKIVTEESHPNTT